jgi:ADP-heptose:LPS heptosyltransferase
MTIHDWTDELDDFADTAALIEALDLVITVDTATAHLAGALGKPVWILNRNDACWRWLTGRDDSPWYPTATLFRQPRPGDWNAVFAEVTEALLDVTALPARRMLPHTDTSDRKY